MSDISRFVSLGAGVQSTTMVLMMAHGEIEPMPDCALFADTVWEPAAVYEHLKWLSSGNVLPFPVHTVSKGDLRQNIIERTNTPGQRFVSVPWFTEDGGMSRRQCTSEYKIEPLEKKQRELLGYKPRQRIPNGSCEVLIGISTDEAWRMKPARNAWQVNRWPLIEKRMNRWDCYNWLERAGYPVVRPTDATPDNPPWPPKSACKGCPFHDNQQWRQLRDFAPDDFADAVAVDHALRAKGPAGKMKQLEYMHRSLVPLDEVDLSTAEDRGQLNLFLNECEGMCGV